MEKKRRWPKGKQNLGSKLRYILGMCYTLVLPETQVISYLNIVLKHMYGLA